MVTTLLVLSGCAAYTPSLREDTNHDGHVTFYDDDPGEWRSESARHMDQQSSDRATAVKASED
jgi:hypothetical protein